jgi:hypothetical protein
VRARGRADGDHAPGALLPPKTRAFLAMLTAYSDEWRQCTRTSRDVCADDGAR